MMRTLRQPGPVAELRLDICRGLARRIDFRVPAGVTLGDGLTAPLAEAGFGAATVLLRGAALAPFRFVMPGPSDGPAHVAYFTAPVAPAGVTRIEQASATFAWADGTPMVHVHAAWTEADGRRRGGHILPLESVVAEPFDVEAWGFADIRAEVAFDAETGFTLPQPTGGGGGDSLFVRIKPNVDLLTTVEGLRVQNARLLGMGSVIGATFTNGQTVSDIATEVLVRQGELRDGVARMELLVVDGTGGVHQGWLKRGENPVCITFDLVLVP